MGLFDSIVGAIQGEVSKQTGGQGDLLSSLMGMINHPEVGGVSGLVQKLSQGGMAEQVASWVGTGANLPINAQQLQAVLGSSSLQDIAAKFGFNSGDMAHQLSALLPQVIDKLTPNGQVPQGDVSHLLAGLGGLFGNKA